MGIKPKTTAEAVRLFQDLFVGFFEDAKAFAESLVEDGVFGEIPERLAYYIDYDAIARDVMIDSYFEIDMPGNQIAVFHRE